MMIKLTPPARLTEETLLNLEPSIFLAGSIEMGSCPDWQSDLESWLESQGCCKVSFNPRSPEWDSSLKQDIDTPKFKEQVDWELDHLEYADIVFFYFDPDTKSPVSLMELGYCLGMGYDYNRIIVVCPQGFWRRGNVQIICKRSEIKVWNSLAEGKRSLLNLLTQNLK